MYLFSHLLFRANKYRQLGCASSVPTSELGTEIASETSAAPTSAPSATGSEAIDLFGEGDGGGGEGEGDGAEDEYDTIAQAPISIPRKKITKKYEMSTEKEIIVTTDNCTHRTHTDRHMYCFLSQTFVRTRSPVAAITVSR